MNLENLGVSKKLFYSIEIYGNKEEINLMELDFFIA
jgi:hypothetical protein